MLAKASSVFDITRPACVNRLVDHLEKPRERMSENEYPAPSKQTSSVPLKKETVRVTLKAADSPPAVPSATVPIAPPVRPPVPVSAVAAPAPTPTAPAIPGPPKPTSAPAPTIPLKTAGPPIVAGAPKPTVSAPAPTIPLKTAGAPTAPGAPRPAPTIPLKTAPGAPGTAGAPAPTIKLATKTVPLTPGASTPTLPKATVQLSPPTQPITPSGPSISPTQAPTLKIEDDGDEENSAAESAAKILSGVCFAAAVALLVFQLMISKLWIEVQDNYNPSPGDWGQLAP